MPGSSIEPGANNLLVINLQIHQIVLMQFKRKMLILVLILGK